MLTCLRFVGVVVPGGAAYDKIVKLTDLLFCEPQTFPTYVGTRTFGGRRSARAEESPRGLKPAARCGTGARDGQKTNGRGS